MMYLTRNAFSGEEYPLSGSAEITRSMMLQLRHMKPEYATFAYGWEMRSRDNSAPVYTFNEERSSSRATRYLLDNGSSHGDDAFLRERRRRCAFVPRIICIRMTLFGTRVPFTWRPCGILEFLRKLRAYDGSLRVKRREKIQLGFDSSRQQLLVDIFNLVVIRLDSVDDIAWKNFHFSIERSQVFE